jgi:DNA topoisomerase-1
LKEAKLYKGSTMLKETSKANVVSLLKSLKNKFRVVDYKNKEAKKNADLPFITSSLQQEAHGKFGFTLKRTMQLAQELYEKGHITYMRTDSYNISEDFQTSLQDYIISSYGETYWNPGGSKKSRKKQKNAQEAHEAIRPTHVEVTSESLKDFSADHKKLYDMIWKRTVAYFMPACIYDEIDIKFADKSFSDDMYFLSTFSRVKFNGYMIVYGVKNEDKEAASFAKYLDALASASKHQINCKELTAKNTWNSPPARYNESSIIKVLESEGIGRPSTYAGIMTKLFDKQYIIKTDVKGIEKPITSYVFSGTTGKLKEDVGSVTIGMERSKLVPTDIGKEIDTFLDEHFSYIIDKQFTASMEADLDRIAEGEKKKLDILQNFWKVFGKDLAKFEGVKQPKTVLTSESNTIDVDGTSYIVRLAKYGPVIETKGEDGKKIFINLKPYLKMMRKEMSDVDAADIKLLTSFPKSLGMINRKEFIFVYGPYGFYGKHAGENIRLTPKTVWSILKGEDEAVDGIKSNIDYHNNIKKQGDKETATSTSTSTAKKIYKKKTS